MRLLPTLALWPQVTLLTELGQSSLLVGSGWLVVLCLMRKIPLRRCCAKQRLVYALNLCNLNFINYGNIHSIIRRAAVERVKSFHAGSLTRLAIILKWEVYADLLNVSAPTLLVGSWIKIVKSSPVNFRCDICLDRRVSEKM